MTTREAFIAVNRFGLGPKPGELGEAAGDPRGWVERQLRARLAPVVSDNGARRMVVQLERQAQARGVRAERRGQPGQERVRPAQPNAQPAEVQPMRQELRELYLADMAARTRAQVESDAPLLERLAAFWSNHFTVSVQRPVILPVVGPFESEAIRPHVLGKFRDMLLAVTRHQAMLFYLDNAFSIGPNSLAGQRAQRGLNENLAREILELHTLGVNGGYTQTDVREFAKILTGWSVARLVEPNAGQFVFRERVHEPGAKTLLGVRYEEAGEREGIAALTALARHPATAIFIATKFARHFIADQPPAALVQRLARVYRDSDGDLRELTRAAIGAPEAWTDATPKVKTPHEFVVSALRAIGATGIENGPLINAQRLLGQLPLAAPSPAGWPDTAAHWIGPEAVVRRAEWAMAVANRVALRIDPMALLEATIGPVARPDTRMLIENAPSRAEAVALVLVSPEFQRR
jgi:uncharacterized protein (DUF1800 family)